MVGQSRDWEPLRDKSLARVPRYVITPPTFRRSWHTYLRSVGGRYLDSIGISEHDDLAVFILSSLDPPNMTFYEDEFVQLFERTLQVIAEELTDITVVVKRHPATLPHYLQQIDDIVARSSKERIVVADLHPMLLATRARFFIANCFSNTYFDAFGFRVPVIEFGHYSPAFLDAMGGGAARPDLTTYFIDNDEEQLRQALRDVMEQPRRAAQFEYLDDPDYEQVMRIMVRAA